MGALVAVALAGGVAVVAIARQKQNLKKQSVARPPSQRNPPDSTLNDVSKAINAGAGLINSIRNSLGLGGGDAATSGGFSSSSSLGLHDSSDPFGVGTLTPPTNPLGGNSSDSLPDLGTSDFQLKSPTLGLGGG